MQRKQDGLMPVQKIRDASPQALHHFTQADQVNLLVSASEADADLGFMARMMVLCSMPRSNPGDRLQYKRVNGPYTLYMNAAGGCKLPFGNLPRPVDGLALDRSGMHSKPRARSRPFVSRVHADIGCLE